MVARPAVSDEALKIQQRLTAVTLAKEQVLAIPEALAPLFPLGGLQQGWSIGVTGDGGWSLAMALLGAALDSGVGSDGWAAMVGLEEVGLVAAAELGVPLDRLLVVETPEGDRSATVVAALVEVVDVVCLGRTPSIGIRDARRLQSRAREQGAVLLHLDGGRGWPHALDVMLEATTRGWSGIGRGHGRLERRVVTVSSTGRRSMAQPRRVEVLLPGPDGRLGSLPDDRTGIIDVGGPARVEAPVGVGAAGG